MSQRQSLKRETQGNDETEISPFVCPCVPLLMNSLILLELFSDSGLTFMILI